MAIKLNPRDCKDTIVVYALPDTFDGQNSPELNDLGTAGSPIRCRVHRRSSGDAVAFQATSVPAGSAEYEIHCIDDPGVTNSTQKLAWTANIRGTFAEPIMMWCHGEARPPHDKIDFYVIACASIV